MFGSGNMGQNNWGGGRKEVPLSDGLDAVVPLSANNLGQVVHTHVPVTKQYNLVPVKGR